MSDVMPATVVWSILSGSDPDACPSQPVGGDGLVIFRFHSLHVERKREFLLLL